MLLDSIGGIFDQNFSTSLARFRVEDAGIIEPGTDTVRNELRVVLLVESPHTDEVGLSDEIHNRHPLEGSAGRHVRDILEQEQLALPDEPIGRLVHRVDDTVRGLGIMNVSQLPFQKEPYRNQDNGICHNQHWKDYIKCMEIIRKDPVARKRKCNKCQRLDDAIVEDLRRRLRSLCRRNSDVRLVPCGEVASTFYTKTKERYLPHPSRNGWQTLNCEERQCLQNIRDLLRPPQQE